MKKITTILILCIATLSVSAQYGVDNIFRKYKNDKGVMAWQFEGDISGMLKTNDGADIKSSIESVDFVLFSDGGDISKKDQIKLGKKVESDKYELLVQARDGGQKVKIMGIESGGKITKVFAQMSMEKMTAYFFLTGDIYLEDLNNINYKSLMEGMDID